MQSGLATAGHRDGKHLGPGHTAPDQELKPGSAGSWSAWSSSTRLPIPLLLKRVRVEFRRGGLLWRQPSGSLCSQHSALQLPGTSGPASPRQHGSPGTFNASIRLQVVAFLSTCLWSVGTLSYQSVRQGCEEDPIKQQWLAQSLAHSK